MKNNIYTSKLYKFVALCIVCLGIAINNVCTVSAPSNQVVAEKTIVAGYDDDNTQDWYPEVKTTKTVTRTVPIVHKVVSGDCVYNLSKQYKATVKTIAAWNKLRNANLIRVGQKLIVGHETREFEESLESINMELEQKPSNLDLKIESVFTINQQNSLYVQNDNQGKDNFSIVDYIRNNKLTGKELLAANMFRKSHELDFIKVAEQLGIKYNYPERREYDLATIAFSTVNKLKYRYGGEMKLIKNGKFANVDCSHFRLRLLQLNGDYDLKYQTTSSLFAKRIRFAKNEEPKIGSSVGYTAYRNRSGELIRGHCWIYIGNNLFAHMSSSHGGVAFSTLEQLEKFAQVKILYMA